MTRIAMWMAMGTTALVAACGGGGARVTFTCTLMNGAATQCDEFDIKSSESAGTQDACTSQGGSITYDPCSTAGALGKCVVKMSGDVDTQYVYPGGAISTTSGAMAECQNVGGTFDAVDSTGSTGSGGDMAGGTQITTTTVSCTESSGVACFQFDVSNAAGISEASSICTEYQAGMPATGGCTLSPRLGICTLPDPSLGTYEEWFEDINQDASGLETQCTQAGGTWQAG